MKKLIFFISLFISLIYLSNAIIITLSSGQKLDNSSWTNLSSVLNKVNVNSSDINIDGKLSVNGKICDIDNNCLGECSGGQVWDSNNNLCVSNITTTASYTPTFHTIIQKGNGTFWGWGYNQRGQLGLGNTTDITTPTQLTHFSGIKQFAIGEQHTIILKTDGTVWTTGYNGRGQLGIGNTADKYSLTKVTTLSGVTEIGAGQFSSYAKKSDGTYRIWGRNVDGELGLGYASDVTTPTKLNVSNIKSIHIAQNHGVILKNNGTVWTTGKNTSYQLGIGESSAKTTFTQIPTLSGIKDIAINSFTTIATKNDGTLRGWGENAYRQLTNEEITYVKTPKNINISGVKKVYGLARAYLFLKNDGTLWGVGKNANGELGLGFTSTKEISIQRIDNISGVLKILSGGNYVVALKTNGTIWSWGRNTEGELGIGNTIEKHSPTQIPSF